MGIELVRHFVNTREIDQDIDELADPASAAAWLTGQGLRRPDDRPLRRPDLERLRHVRESLRELLLANNGEPAMVDRARRDLNRAAARAALTVRFEPSGDAELAPSTANPADRVIAAVLADVHAAMHDGTWTRLKCCREDTCQWAFYDHSKNRSGSWCSMKVCGNRNKARSFRQRHAD